MNRYYVLIDEPNQITMETKFFTVEVGETERCQKALGWLRKWCWEHGAYFAMRSAYTDKFMLNIADSLNTKVFLLPSLLVKVQPLVAHIRNFNCTPNMPQVNPQEVYLRKQTDPKFLFICNTSCRKRSTSKT